MEERTDDTGINLKGQVGVSQVSRVQDIPERGNSTCKNMGCEWFILQTTGHSAWLESWGLTECREQRGLMVPVKHYVSLSEKNHQSTLESFWVSLNFLICEMGIIAASISLSCGRNSHGHNTHSSAFTDVTS